MNDSDPPDKGDPDISPPELPGSTVQTQVSQPLVSNLNTPNNPSPVFHELANNRKTFVLKDKDALKYSDDSVAPFTVAISHDGIGNKHPTLIGESLYRQKILGIKSIKKINKNLIHLEFIKKEFANNLVEGYENLLSYDKCKCFIPSNLITRRIIVNDVHTDIEIDSVGNFLQEKYKNIISVRRIFKKNEDNALVPTSKLDVLWEGTVIPDYLYVFYTSCKTNPYIYNVTKCTHCLSYGHRAYFKDSLTCKSAKRCPKCTETHAAQDICPNKPHCLQCNISGHVTFSNECPELLIQKKIKKLMAYENISYRVAADHFQKLKNNQITLKLNERLQQIQDKVKKGESINEFEMQLASFPKLTNKFDPITETEPMETNDNFQYSLSDLRRPYSEVLTSPSPTRKKAKTLDVELEMPSDEWFLRNYSNLPENLTQKPDEEPKKGLWPKIFHSAQSNTTQSSTNSKTSDATEQPLNSRPNLNNNITPKANTTNNKPHNLKATPQTTFPPKKTPTKLNLNIAPSASNTQKNKEIKSPSHLKKNPSSPKNSSDNSINPNLVIGSEVTISSQLQ